MEKWPALPLIRPYIKNTKYFRFGSKLLYTDIPIGSIANVYQEIVEKCDCEPTIEMAKDCANDILNEVNKNINDNIRELTGTSNNIHTNWLKITVKRMTNSDKPLHVIYHVDWTLFHAFLKEIAGSIDISLEKKYKYIISCKLSAEELSAKTIKQLIEKRSETGKDSSAVYIREFAEFVSPYKNETISLLRNLCDETLSELNLMQKLYRNSSLTSFLPDLLQTIITLINLIEAGRISSFYRECRSLVERLSWVIMDDFLLTNSIDNKMGKFVEVPSLFLNISEEWYGNKKGVPPIRELKDFSDEFNKRTGEKFDLEGGGNSILQHMSYETYLALTGKEKKDKVSDYVPSYNHEFLLNGVTQLQIQFSNAFTNRKSNKMFATLQNELSAFNEVTPRYPNTKFVLQFLEAVTGRKVTLLYFWNNYSLFIHPYLYTWQLIPDTSALEYYILLGEVKKLTETLSKMINFEIKHVRTALK